MEEVAQDLEYWEARCLEAEEALKACAHALALTPVADLRRGITWIPSETALYEIETAKLAIERFAGRNWV